MDADHIIATYYGSEDRRHWTPSELEYALTHTYKTGVNVGIREWFFPTFLYLEFWRKAADDGGQGNPGSNRKLIYNQSDSSHVYSPSRKLDWEWLLGRYFSEATVNGEHEGLRALEESITTWKAQLGQPKLKHQVVLGLPDPYYEQGFEGWGTLDGVTINVRNDADRITAVKWFVDELIGAFNAKDYQNIELSGLYWVEETVTNNKDVMAAVGEYVQSKGLKFLWIPFSNANGRFEWAAQNVTDAWLQTGYFWKNGIINPEVLTEQGLRDLCDQAIEHGMSVEFEVSRHLFPNRGRGDYSVIDSSLMDRLDTLAEVFREKSIFGRRDITYYFDPDMIIKMSVSDNARVMGYMDMLAEVISGNGYRTNAELLLLRHMMG